MLRVHEELKFNTLIVRTLILLSLLLSLTTEVVAQQVSGIISRVGDTTHLEFRGRKEWKYESPKKSGNKLIAIVPPFDDATIVQLQSWNCPLIQKIEVLKNAPDGQFELQITLNSSQAESFDYLTDDPSNLIIDIFEQPKAEVATIKNDNISTAAKQDARNDNTTRKSSAEVKSRVGRKSRSEYTKKDRSPASTEFMQLDNANLKSMANSESSEQDKNKSIVQFERGAFDGGDPNFERFRIKDYQVRDEAIIASRSKIYIPFPMLALKYDRFSEIMSTPPEYEIKIDDKMESKEAALLITLFNKNRMGAFFETLSYFEDKYPDSKYNEIVKNLKAEAYIKVYERDGDPKDLETYRSLYRYLIETYPDSALTERNSLVLAYSSLQKGDGAETLRELQKHLIKYPNTIEKNKIKLTIGEALHLLNKTDESIAAYQEVVKTAGDNNFEAEAAYRIGDVLFSAKNYAEAITVYKKVQAEYPKHKTVFPNAQFNLAEAYFWQNDYRNSLDAHIDFLKMFPTHKYGGYSQTRIGEILEILGADQKMIMGAFIEGYFRYPDSPGSEVSRIRMLTGGLKDMKEREKKRALAEIDEITKKSTLPKISEFTTLMKAEGFSNRQDHETSLELLLSYYQNNPTTVNAPVFKARILRSMSDILKTNIKDAKYIEALNFYGKYSMTWMKNTDRIDAPYFQGLAFEKSGVLNESKKIYAVTRKKLEKAIPTKEFKERLVAENLPSLDSVKLRQAAIAAKEKNYKDSNVFLSDIKGVLSPDEEIEKVQIGAEVSENMGDIKKAIGFLEKLTDVYKDAPNLVVRPRLDLIRLHVKEGSFNEADKHLSLIENSSSDLEKIDEKDKAKILEYRAELQFRNGQKLAAVETYSKLLEQFETKYPLSSVRFKAGKILFDEGDLKGAEKLWSSLDAEKGAFYKKLASEMLTQADWQDTYKKYINRLPAGEKLK